MKTELKLFIIAVIVLSFGYFTYTRSVTAPVVQAPIVEASPVGCYVAHLAKDVYSLNVKTATAGVFAGTLSFQNFEKDSSKGIFTGTYKDGVLLGAYSFASEGMNSVRQVIFKKVGDNFVEGFGDYDAKGENFADLTKITYDSKSTFVPSNTCTY